MYIFQLVQAHNFFLLSFHIKTLVILCFFHLFISCEQDFCAKLKTLISQSTFVNIFGYALRLPWTS